jgi:hypothetical protein
MNFSVKERLGGGKERILEGEEDEVQHDIYTYEDSIMKPNTV